MVSLHEQVSDIAFAPPPPIPLFDLTRLTVPADGKAFRALMVGGRPHTHADLKQPLEAFGISLIAPHWHSDRARLPIDIPKGTEVMLIVTTVIGHELSNHARSLASKAGIPYIGISTKASAWSEKFGRYGLKSPPAWRSPPSPMVTAADPERTMADVMRDTADPFYLAMISARKDSKLSQKAVGEKVGANYATVSNWECGYSTPRFATYRLLLDVLPTLRNYPPPIALEARVRELLTPTPEQIAAVAPEPPSPPTLAPIAALGVQYAEAIAEAEHHKRSADDAMRAAESLMDLHKAASERAEVLRSDILTLATKG